MSGADNYWKEQITNEWRKLQVLDKWNVGVVYLPKYRILWRLSLDSIYFKRRLCSNTTSLSYQEPDSVIRSALLKDLLFQMRRNNVIPKKLLWSRGTRIPYNSDGGVCQFHFKSIVKRAAKCTDNSCCKTKWEAMLRVLPPTDQTCLATIQVVAGYEKLLQSREYWICKFYWWVESVWLLLHKFRSHFGIFGVKYQTFQHMVLACIHYREGYTK